MCAYVTLEIGCFLVTILPCLPLTDALSDRWNGFRTTGVRAATWLKLR